MYKLRQIEWSNLSLKERPLEEGLPYRFKTLNIGALLKTKVYHGFGGVRSCSRPPKTYWDLILKAPTISVALPRFVMAHPELEIQPSLQPDFKPQTLRLKS